MMMRETELTTTDHWGTTDPRGCNRRGRVLADSTVTPGGRTSDPAPVMTRLVMATLILSALLAAGCGEHTNRPGVILIVIDTLRADLLGCYGSDRGATPALDAFAAESVRFERAYSQSPWTLPSFATLFTSTFPSEHGARGRIRKDFFPIREDLTTVAEALKAEGFRTGAVVNNIFLKGGFGFRRGFDDYDFFPAEISKIRKADEVTSRGIHWLKNPKGEEGSPFLFLHYFDPHYAYLPPKALAQRFGGSFTERLRKLSGPDAIRTGEVKLDDWDKRNLRGLYEAEVAFTDREVGRLLEHLKTTGILDESIVIITSDHGEEFWDHGGFEHGHTQYDELVRVPLLIRFPGGRRGGSVVIDPVRLMDLAPTVLDELDIAKPATFRGESFRYLVEGESGSDGPIPFLFEECLYGNPRQALMVGSLKVIEDPETGRVELFDLAADPGETRDLAAERPEDRDRLLKALRAFREKLKRRAPGDAGAVNLPPELEEALKALSYVH